MTQLTLEDYVTTGRDHPATSRAAAASVLPKSGTQRWRVWVIIDLAGERGMTDDGIAEALDLPGNSVRPRRRELEQAGLIRRNGQTRPNAFQNECDVWVTVTSPAGEQ